MSLELDHAFICTSVGAPEAEALIRFGLLEGAPNRHLGQGTANRRFFFENAFLELLWVENPAEAQSALVRRTGIFDRWSNRGAGASPFGICLRPTGIQQAKPSFPTWEYRPTYLPEPLTIHMATDSHASGRPLMFCITFGRPPASDEPARRQPIAHPVGLRAVTGLTITTPDRGFAETTQQRAIEQLCQQIRFLCGSEHLIEFGFDGQTRGRTVDFRPELPLLLHW